MPYKIAQLTVLPEHKSEVLSRVFVSQPDMEEEQILGKLFVVMDIKNNKTDIMLANFIIDRLTLFYYQNEQAPLLARLATVTVSDIFENSLAKLNQEFMNFTRGEKLIFNPQLFNITIGVIFKNKLYFSGIGRNKSLLIYKSKLKNNRQVNDYDLLNISSSTADPTQEVVLDNKLFASTVSGAIPPSGYVVVVNESLYEFLSEKQLIKIITTLPPAGAAEQIKNILEQTNVYLPFVGLIIKNQQPAKISEDWPVTADPRVKVETSPVYHTIEPNRRREQEFRQERDLNKESIKALNRTAARTAQILRPPGFVNWDGLKKLLHKIKWPSGVPKTNKLVVKRANLAWLKREGWLSFKKLKDFLSKSTVIGRQIIDQARRAYQQTRRREPLAEMSRATGRRWGRRHWLILGIIALCLAAFGLSLSFNAAQKAKRQQAEAWDDAWQQYQERAKQIAAELLYSKERALLSYDGLEQIRQQLAANAGPAHAAELAQINRDYQDLTDRLSGLVRLTSPQKIWTAPNAVNQLIAFNERLYVAAPSGGEVWSFRPADRESRDWKIQADSIRLLNGDNQNRLWLLAPDELIGLDANGNQQNLPLSGQSDSAYVYNNRLYRLDNAAAQIWRQDLLANGLGPSQPWLQTPLTQNANTLAIDASIFLLRDREIVKYDAGQGQTLSLDLMPSLTNAKRLSAAGDVLAVLEPITRRLIFLSRSGQLLRQVTSDVWDNLKDMTLDANGKTAYVLNNNDVYQVNLK